MRFGYARVSTCEQDTALQVRLFRTAGVSVYFEDAVSGVKRRPELEKLLAMLRGGDELVVYKVDRLARSLSGLLEVLEAVAERGASFRSLTEPFDTSTLSGRLMLQMLGAFAEFERGMIRERCAAGRAAAMARGICFGRPRKIDRQAALQMRLGGAEWHEIGRIYGVSGQSVYCAVRRERLASGLALIP